MSNRRTIPCKFFEVGTCNRGDKCPFSHGEPIKNTLLIKEPQKLPYPDEIYLRIFSYLSTNDILENIALVCHEFYRLSKDSQIIKEIKFQEKVIKSYGLRKKKKNKNPSQNLKLPRPFFKLHLIKNLVLRSSGLTKLDLEHRSELCSLFVS